MGWNVMREQIFANQKRLGVIPPNTQLTPWPDLLPKWDTLDADSKKLFARQAEVFAGFLEHTDDQIGRFKECSPQTLCAIEPGARFMIVPR
jgi:arylsulfatase